MPSRKQRTTVVALGAAFVLLSSTIASSLNGIVPFFFNATANAAGNNRIINSAMVASGASTTVAPSSSIAANVNVTSSKTIGDSTSDNFEAVGWVVAKSTPTASDFTCDDFAPNHTASGTFDQSFNITAPSTAGSYNAYFVAYQDNDCTDSTASDVFTLANAVTVSSAADTTPPSQPTANPVGGTYTSAQLVALSSSDNSGVAPTIHYTTDGSTPDNSSSVYSTPLNVSTSETIKAIAYDAAGNASPVGSFSYTINSATGPVQNTTTGIYYPTIQAAVAGANSGDSLVVASGSYSGAINVDKKLTIKGANAGTVGNGTRSPESTLTGQVNITASSVTVDGFSFNKNGAQANVTSPTTLSGIVFQNDIFDGYTSVGMPTNNAGNILIQKNLFENVSGSGEAMQIKSNSDPKSCSGTQVLNNKFNNASNSGGADINFSCNLTPSYATTDFSSNITVANNASSGETASFMSFSGISGVSIHGNTATGVTGNTAIFFHGSVTGAVIIENNQVTGGTSNAVDIYNGAVDSHNRGPSTGTFTITHNDFSNNTNGISVASDALSGSGAVVAHENNLSGDTTGVNNSDTTLVDATKNFWGGASGPNGQGSGSGSAVSSNVSYDPWCTDAACTTFSNSIAPPTPSTVVVKSGDPNWSTSDTRTNGHVDFVTDSNAPNGVGALSLKTDANPTSSQDKAQFYNYEYYASPLALSNVTGELSYYTKQNSASFSAGDPGYQIPAHLQDASGKNKFVTLTYEPYLDKGNSAVKNGQWRKWTIDRSTSKFYVSNSVSNANGGVIGGSGDNLYTLDRINAIFPGAEVLGFGANVGSSNPGYDTEVDDFTFNNTTYNFEPNAPADTQPPVISNIVPANGTPINGTTRFSVDVKDASGVQKVALYLRNNNGSNNEFALKQDSGDSWYYDVNTKALAGDGTYNVVLRAVADGGTNRVTYFNNRENSYAVTVDNTAPKVDSVTAHFANGTDKSAPTINDAPHNVGYNPTSFDIQASDNGGSGVDYIRAIVYRQTNNGPKPLGSIDNSGNSSNIKLANHNNYFGNDGEYILVIQAKDNAGNPTSHNVKVDFTIDTTAPRVNITAPTSAQPVNGTVNIKGSVTDNVKLKNYYLTVFDLDNNKVVYTKNYNLSANIGSGQLASWNTAGLNGNYRIIIEARDAAGNKDGSRTTAGVSVAYVDVRVDNSGPVVSGVMINGKSVGSNYLRAANCEATDSFYTVSGDVDLSAIINDASSDGNSAKYSIRKVTPNGCTHTGVYASRSVGMHGDAGDQWLTNSGTVFDTNDIGSDGQYTIWLITQDKLGNKTNQYVDINVDNTAPSLTINPIGDNTSSSRTISGTSDDPSDVVVRVDGSDKTVTPTGSAGSYTWSVKFTGLSVGSHNVSVTSTDSAGNTTNPAETASFSRTTIIPPSGGGGAGGSGGGGGNGGGSGGSSSVSSGGPTISSFNNSNTTPGLGGGSLAGVNANTGTGSSNNAGQQAVLGAQTKNDKKKLADNQPSSFGSDGQVLGNNTSKEKTCSKFLGICWYYWIPIVIAVAAIVAYLLNRRRNRLPETV